MFKQLHIAHCKRHGPYTAARLLHQTPPVHVTHTCLTPARTPCVPCCSRLLPSTMHYTDTHCHKAAARTGLTPAHRPCCSRLLPSKMHERHTLPAGLHVAPGRLPRICPACPAAQGCCHPQCSTQTNTMPYRQPPHVQHNSLHTWLTVAHTMPHGCSSHLAVYRAHTLRALLL
jgi:hypothetical protein